MRQRNVDSNGGIAFQAAAGGAHNIGRLFQKGVRRRRPDGGLLLRGNPLIPPSALRAVLFFSLQLQLITGLDNGGLGGEWNVQ